MSSKRTSQEETTPCYEPHMLAMPPVPQPCLLDSAALDLGGRQLGPPDHAPPCQLCNRLPQERMRLVALDAVDFDAAGARDAGRQQRVHQGPASEQRTLVVTWGEQGGWGPLAPLQLATLRCHYVHYELPHQQQELRNGERSPPAQPCADVDEHAARVQPALAPHALQHPVHAALLDAAVQPLHALAAAQLVLPPRGAGAVSASRRSKRSGAQPKIAGPGPGRASRPDWSFQAS